MVDAHVLEARLEEPVPELVRSERFDAKAPEHTGQRRENARVATHYSGGKATVRTQHPRDLGERARRIGKQMQRAAAVDEIEARGAERKLLRVAPREEEVAEALLRGESFCMAQHRAREVEAHDSPAAQRPRERT